MTTARSSHYDRQHVASCLEAQAHLCERIAAECADERTAEKFRAMAKKCRDTAVENMDPVAAKWPVVLAF